MRPDVVTMLVWLLRLVTAFLVISGALLAGFAPYSESMGEVLRVVGAMFLGAALCAGSGALLKRLSGRRRDL